MARNLVIPVFIILLILLIVLTAPSARSSEPVSPRSYSETTKSGQNKKFRLVRTTGNKSDTTNFVWTSFGTVDSILGGTILYGYQERIANVKLNNYFTADDSSITFYPSINQTEDSDGTCELHAPLEAGKNWQYKLTDTAEAGIVSMTETVVVPAGTYKDCLVVETAPGIEKYYAPDIGLIKIVEKGKGYTTMSELVFVNNN